MNDFHETEERRVNGREDQVRAHRFSVRPICWNASNQCDPTEDTENRKHPIGVEPRNGMNQQTILYVDDNAKAIRMMQFVLNRTGYNFLNASSALEVSERMRQSKCDLLLVSHGTLKMTGLEPILAIKKLSPRTPVILITSCALLPEPERNSVDAHVGKGATLDVLLGKIRALVLRHESSPASASGPHEEHNQTRLSA
jgi:CheY-like chemotaxis protein